MPSAIPSIALAAGGLLLARAIAKRSRSISLDGRVVLITGGSRGLGLELARAFAARELAVAICARDEHELETARLDLEARGANVLAAPCDVSHESDVRRLIETCMSHFGRLDVVVNNAGIMLVGPADAMTTGDFEHVMSVNFWGTFHVAREALARLVRGGRIVNITSIGAEVAIPHLLPYTAAKFAARGFSEGLYAEAIERGVRVVTVEPGLMRTGSARFARFRGDRQREFGWFSTVASLPLFTLSAPEAADRIVRACENGDPLVTLGLPARLLRLFHGIFPAATMGILGVVNRVLPGTSLEGSEKTNIEFREVT